MNRRALRGRLEQAAIKVPASRALCALHGDLCQMGRRWPLEGPAVDLYYMIRGAKIRTGVPVEEPDPFTINKHRPETKAERRDREQRIAAASAQVAATEAEIIAGGDPE